MHPELVKLAQAHFPATKWRSLSNFCNSALKAELRKMAPKLAFGGHIISPELLK